MGGSVDLGRFVPRPDIDPKAERDRVDRLDPVGRDPQPVAEQCHLGAHAALAARRAWARRYLETAAASFGSSVIRSRRCINSPRTGGSGGGIPVARSTALGALGVWAP